MYSKAKLLGHPIHPMLVAFPVAFYTGSLVAFIVYAATTNLFWFRVANVANWAGVATAAVAAIPGVIDWATGIPRRSAAKSTGLLHAALNVSALVAFLICGVIGSNHWDDVVPPAAFGVVLSAIGVLLTLPAGFLGWSLVQDHHVGVQLTPAQEQLEPRTPSASPQPRTHTPVASH